MTVTSEVTVTSAALTKQDIFHYVYAVLHNPAYREKYKLNLKREFPRIPFYDDFYRWAAWGAQLMELHLNYESITPASPAPHRHRPRRDAQSVQSEVKSGAGAGFKCNAP